MPSNKSQKLRIINHIIESSVTELDFLDSSDSEDDIFDQLSTDLSIILHSRYSVPLSKVPRSQEWFNAVLPSLDESRFKQMLRVSRLQFNVILELLQTSGRFTYRQLPTHLQLAVTLHRLGSYGEGASLVKIAALFGIGDGGTIDRCTRRVFKALLLFENKYIHWPSTSERDQIVAETFRELPRCIGYVDGSEIHLAEAPTLDHESYFSRKQRYGIKIQATCDHKLRIRHVVIGYPASVHDAKIFANSNLFRTPTDYFSDGQWLAGDSAYKLTDSLITPFRRNSTFRSLKERQAFNRRFSSFRVRIENTFGLLKEKFCSMKELRIRVKDKKSHTFACQWILVCCILHNILLPYLTEEELQFDCAENEEDEDGNVRDQDDKQGELKRKAIFYLLNEM